MACMVARAEGHRYIWIDSCCIDKTSSSELSEAINSMYGWYEEAEVCYAYLADVPPRATPHSKESPFGRSRWFTRGWTLQELIAPDNVHFLSADWSFLGSKRNLAGVLEGITGVSQEALLHKRELGEFSVAQRFSWASKRQTKRVEDQAYALMRLFAINMPTLYGEGQRAVQRLQEEIMRRTPDQSLFAWEDVLLRFDAPQEPDAVSSVPGGKRFACMEYPWGNASLFASFLDRFADGSSIKYIPHDEVSRRLRLSRPAPIEYTFTPHGIRTHLPILPLSAILAPRTTLCPEHHPLSHWYLAIFGCEHRSRPGHLSGGSAAYHPPSQESTSCIPAASFRSQTPSSPPNGKTYYLCRQRRSNAIFGRYSSAQPGWIWKQLAGGRTRSSSSHCRGRHWTVCASSDVQPISKVQIGRPYESLAHAVPR
ncbi:hypothetical protein BD309DRAFT_89836 [Dichomitus squalens]|uniref:Uncharacterized protein n=1 Tax=Dichomitus squalens TaxID=114155 RepID=A0A4Q9PL30_9APHY|nr:hypothetical protein BD309DRAFT_89836 [Dichomitus squalens]TBU54852.1 hypothetical protein BD310DRAFT_726286 [Dichomitus squalens]